MDKNRAKELQKRMPYKHVFFDIIHRCYRLLDPTRLHQYQDEEGKYHDRQNVSTLIPVK